MIILFILCALISSEIVSLSKSQGPNKAPNDNNIGPEQAKQTNPSELPDQLRPVAEMEKKTSNMDEVSRAKAAQRIEDGQVILIKC